MQPVKTLLKMLILLASTCECGYTQEASQPAGVTTSTFVPSGNLVRAQMAVFLVRTFLILP